ncbi:YggS family pyridoxal phosphate enzyme [Spirochaetia bacterium]|nr:YggS family pyridoxal phosphate enzyme [Spirochaetia bacterium]
MTAFAERLQGIEERIARACLRSGRNRSEIKLMGVSKFHGIDRIEEARQNGIRLFGESRVQEAAEKFSAPKEFNSPATGVELHMIGSLQRNKAKTAISLFDCIQSVDRESIIAELGKYAAETALEKKAPLKVLLELHTGEESKAGFSDEESLLRAAAQVLEFSGLVPAGLMTMAPYSNDTDLVRSSFRALVRAQKKLEKEFPGSDWSCLSMGMSNDFEIAIEEGSTLLRIGTALFGDRDYGGMQK